MPLNNLTMPNENTAPIKIFFAYSRSDTQLLQELRTFLQPLERRKDIQIWYDGEIKAGEVWGESIKKNLHAADIILLLLSSDALASDYFWEHERADALARHQRGECIVVPVILRHCDWDITELAELQALPKDGIPITDREWASHDKAYKSISGGIVALINQINDRRKQEEREIESNQEREKQEQLRQKQAEEQRRKEAEAAEHLRKENIKRMEREKAENKRKFWEKLQSADKLFAQQQYVQALAAYIALQNWGDKSTLGYTDAQPHISQRIMLCRQEQQKQQQEQQSQRNALLKKMGMAVGGVLLLFMLRQNASQWVNTMFETNNNTPVPVNTAETYTETALGLGLIMHRIRGGTFTMGCTKEQGSDCYDNEKPAHEVTLNSFKISRYEVTQAQWRAVMGGNPAELYNTGCDNCPVENVSWDDVQGFLHKLNQQTGKAYRLPTEAEWEFAARGGNQSKGYKYAGSDDVGAVAWYDNNYESSKYGSQGTTHPIGTKAANELGLYDMTGNVWEWCSDWYDVDYYTSRPRDNPQGASLGSFRVVRGGSWLTPPQHCRVVHRNYNTSGYRHRTFGFRLVSSQ